MLNLQNFAFLIWIVGVLSESLCPLENPSPNSTCQCISTGVRCTGTEGTFSLRQIQEELGGVSIGLVEMFVPGLGELQAGYLDGIHADGLLLVGNGIKAVQENAFGGMIGPQALSLADNLLNIVPSSALQTLAHLERLDLSRNRIERIGKRAFEGLASLQHLDLSGNGVSEIADEALARLPHLERLDLSDCQMDDLPDLSGLPQLSELALRNCQLKKLDRFFLRHAVRLQTLDLSHNNLTRVDSNAFPPLPSLTTLDLSQNQIRLIEEGALSQLSGLQTIDLSGNWLALLPTEGIGPLPKLNFLSLDNNFLTHIGTLNLAGMEELLTLSLRDNDIVTIHEGAFKQLHKLLTIHFDDNILHCDCGLQDLARWLRDHPTLDGLSRRSAICQEPLSLSGRPLVDVALESLECDDLDILAPSEAYFRRMQETEAILEQQELTDRSLHLSWRLLRLPLAFKCDSLFVTEERDSEPLVRAKHVVHCDSRQLIDPRKIHVTADHIDLPPARTYRFCLVLLTHQRPLLACSNPLLWTGSQWMPELRPKFYVNTTGSQGLRVSWPLPTANANMPCRVRVTVRQMGDGIDGLTAHIVNCSERTTTFGSLSSGVHYNVCVSVEHVGARCVTALVPLALSTDNTVTLVLATALGAITAILLVLIALFAKKLITKQKNIAIPTLGAQGLRYTILLNGSAEGRPNRTQQN